MKTLQTANNGQALQIMKDYDELTDNEISTLRFPCGDTKEDYENYIVHYKKDGTLIRVSVNEYSDSKKISISEHKNTPNVATWCRAFITPENDNKETKKSRNIAKKEIAEFIENK